MRKKIHHSKRSQSFSLRSPRRKRIHSTTELGKRPERGFSRIRQVRSSRRKTLKSYGISWKRMCPSQMMALRESTMTNSYTFQPDFQASANNSLQLQLSSSLKETNMDASKSFPSFTMWSGKLICFRLEFRFLCMMPLVTDTLEKKILKTTSSNWCPPSHSLRICKSHSILSMLSQQLGSSSFT